jgi:uncharacterized membrane protein YdjX (TVP38/TMEM64 family)
VPALAALLLGGLFFWILFTRLDLPAFQTWAGGLGNAWIFLMLAMLPLFGFPVSVLYFLVGARFGFAVGLGFTSLSIAVNLLATHWIASSFLRRAVQSALQRTRFHLPAVASKDHAFIAFLAPFLPGPYAIKNYLLALSGVPLRLFLGICLPVYAFRASAGLLMGGVSQDAGFWKLTLLVVYGTGTVFVCRWVLKRWKLRLES